MKHNAEAKRFEGPEKRVKLRQVLSENIQLGNVERWSRYCVWPPSKGWSGSMALEPNKRTGINLQLLVQQAQGEVSHGRLSSADTFFGS